jgi:hypothetical protein
MNIIDNDDNKFTTDDGNFCCICFESKKTICITSSENIDCDATLDDIDTSKFENGIIPNDILILSVCRKHYLCIACLRNIINNYENHPINSNNSHFSCPYPFKPCTTDIGFSNTFSHQSIKKIFQSEEELNNYISYVEQYEFPGYTIIKCPFKLYGGDDCNAQILIDNDDLRHGEEGDIIVECNQNERCRKRFCYHCKNSISYSYTFCNDCKLTFENENPNVFNYYFNKNINKPVDETLYSEPVGLLDTSTDVLKFNESDYLYQNKEITEDIAISQITSVISDINSHMICPICKISIYKTEKCNGLSHHGIERCYACSRIGLKIKGLVNHWSCLGEEGCYRFDNETFVTKYIPTYMCSELYCSNHEKGDCKIEDHQQGILDLEVMRKSAYVYHMIKSLLPKLRYTVYDKLYETFKDKNELIYLPYKQSLFMTQQFKNRSRDYFEDIVYDKLNCKHPKQIFNNKSDTISANEYITMYCLEKTDDKEFEESQQSLSSTTPILLFQGHNYTLLDDDVDMELPIQINSDSESVHSITEETSLIPHIINNNIDSINGGNSLSELVNRYNSQTRDHRRLIRRFINDRYISPENDNTNIIRRILNNMDDMHTTLEVMDTINNNLEDNEDQSHQQPRVFRRRNALLTNGIADEHVNILDPSLQIIQTNQITHNNNQNSNNNNGNINNINDDDGIIDETDISDLIRLYEDLNLD